MLQHLNEERVGACEVEGWVLEGPSGSTGPGQADPRGTRQLAKREGPEAGQTVLGSKTNQ